LITTGAKLWFGITAIAVVAAVAYAVVSGGEWFGSLVLGTFAVGAAVIGFAAVSSRDGDVDVDDTTAIVPVRRALPAPWPALSGAALGFAVVGLATGSPLWWAGIGLGAVVLAEWMVQAWAERATGDHAYNRDLRNRMMFPFEFPVIAAVVVAFVVLGFSRVLLALPQTGSWVVAGLVAAVILAIAALIATRPRISSSVLTGVLALGAVAVLAGGIVGAVVGEREFHPHEEAHDEQPGADGSQHAEGDEVEGGPEDDPTDAQVPDEVDDTGGESVPDARDESGESGSGSGSDEPDPDETTEVSAP
jgi:hypothetical protein